MEGSDWSAAGAGEALKGLDMMGEDGEMGIGDFFEDEDMLMGFEDGKGNEGSLGQDDGYGDRFGEEYDDKGHED